METSKPVINIFSDKPQAELPPSLEPPPLEPPSTNPNNDPLQSTVDEKQWMEGIQTTANNELHQQDIEDMKYFQNISYTPHIFKMSSNSEINAHLLMNTVVQ